jgi:hypothetical protein
VEQFGAVDSELGFELAGLVYGRDGSQIELLKEKK